MTGELLPPRWTVLVRTVEAVKRSIGPEFQTSRLPPPRRDAVMSNGPRWVAATVVAGGALALPAAPALAADPHCDAYSGHCPQVEPRVIERPPTQVLPERFTLPFTGGDFVLMATAGAAAIGTGVVLTVSARRRRGSCGTRT